MARNHPFQKATSSSATVSIQEKPTKGEGLCYQSSSDACSPAGDSFRIFGLRSIMQSRSVNVFTPLVCYDSPPSKLKPNHHDALSQFDWQLIFGDFYLIESKSKADQHNSVSHQGTKPAVVLQSVTYFVPDVSGVMLPFHYLFTIVEEIESSLPHPALMPTKLFPVFCVCVCFFFVIMPSYIHSNAPCLRCPICLHFQRSNLHLQVNLAPHSIQTRQFE